LLVSGATRTVRRLIGHPNLGILLVPKDRNAIPPDGVTWAADNGCFGGLDDATFRSFLKRIENEPRCKWVTAPDVVGDAERTLELWPEWSRVIRDHGLPPAFVAQDGQVADDVPWDTLAAVFIGGTTAWKLGSEAARIIVRARKLGVWVHMGRVNTLRRLAYAMALEVTSIDGSKFSKFAETYLPSALDFVANLQRQRRMDWKE